MTARSNRAEVRNPVLALPSIRALQALDPGVRALLVALLHDLRRDARARAEKCWDTRKPPLAAYWAAVAVHAGHTAKALRPNREGKGTSPSMIVRQPGYPDFAATDWADASRCYSLRRDLSGLGASGFPEAEIVIERVPIARISYNGRIWPLGSWDAGQRPIYDSRTATGAAHGSAPPP